MKRYMTEMQRNIGRAAKAARGSYDAFVSKTVGGIHGIMAFVGNHPGQG